LPESSIINSRRARIRAFPAVLAEPIPGASALNGRSFRNRRYVGAVNAVRGGVAASAVSCAVVIAIGFGIGFGFPADAAATTTASVRELSLQSLTVATSAPLAVSKRDAYGVTAPPPLRWPVNPSSPINSGFGLRVAPCSGCSSNHEGADYDAGFGATVHAIAAGVVVETNNPGLAALGIHVAIQHVIDGTVITSVYGHMQVGSMALHVGDVVFVGQPVGLVGSTGASTGAHLHFEIRLDGTNPVDPVAWMRARLG
jgi:murein DD-endopeptidase MepM/ murein hydrolase activator NlpD